MENLEVFSLNGTDLPGLEASENLFRGNPTSVGPAVLQRNLSPGLPGSTLGNVGSVLNFTRSSKLESLPNSSLQAHENLDGAGGTRRNSSSNVAQVADDSFSKLDIEPVINTSIASQDILINFQPNSSILPAGYVKDIGDAYDDARGFGWVRQDSLGSTMHQPLSIVTNTRDRKLAGIEQRLDTLMHMQYPATPTNSETVKTPAAWEYALPTGTYNVTVSVGDQPFQDSQHTINVEGVTAIDRFQSSSRQAYKQATVQAKVSDSRLTIDAIGGTNTKINYIQIQAFGPTVLPGTTYYVSPFGNDSSSGTSQAQPWKTLSKVNNFTFRPGDKIFLKGGATFDGRLSFDAKDFGTSLNPITIGSYGTNRATVNAGNSFGLYAHNTSGYRISGLNFLGTGHTRNTGDGISFYNNLAGNLKLGYVHIDNVDVSGFGKNGIAIGGWNKQSGYQNVRITNTLAHGNGIQGILTYAEAPNTNQNIYVGYSKAYNNSGISGDPNPTGSGIVLGSVNNGTIEHSVAYKNGWLNDTRSGPVGIWAYDSNNVTIQYNESYNNRTGGRADGGGFDFDQNVSNSVMQYNYSHGNDGAGYLLAHAPDNQNHKNNIIRYNISRNDGRKNGNAGIAVWGRVRNTEIHNNTIFVSRASVGTPRAIWVHNLGIPDRDVSNLDIHNNIFRTTDGVRLVEVSADQLDGATGLRFQDNDYYSANGIFQVAWGTKSYSSKNAWRTATGKE